MSDSDDDDERSGERGERGERGGDGGGGWYGGWYGDEDDEDERSGERGGYGGWYGDEDDEDEDDERSGERGGDGGGERGGYGGGYGHMCDEDEEDDEEDEDGGRDALDMMMGATRLLDVSEETVCKARKEFSRRQQQQRQYGGHIDYNVAADILLKSLTSEDAYRVRERDILRCFGVEKNSATKKRSVPTMDMEGFPKIELGIMLGKMLEGCDGEQIETAIGRIEDYCQSNDIGVCGSELVELCANAIVGRFGKETELCRKKMKGRRERAMREINGILDQ